MLSAVSFVAAMLLYSIGFSFRTFVLAELFFALGLSFYSGTGSALVYDTLSDLKEENSYNKIWGNAKYYALLAMALAHIIGGFVGNIDLRWAIYLSVPFLCFLCRLYCLCMNRKDIN